ncbi:uncharacterized protein EDB93DRAFT_1154736 [Suillus bovinus]|uniref:uncharacterized protein n=1 Tax=Suillus bovinus TaxID=48563 RepID=UPI001B86DA1D|nr:uncharacterized protein EDB93DRAFT_1154736 [Suillus bovinus]KAG2143782.1 hypothetical protein EDB93DRAFT_1154736 [Suillus bovinus]
MFVNFSALQELTICAYDHSEMLGIATSVSQLPIITRNLKITFPVLTLYHFSIFAPLLAHLTNIEVAIDQMDAVPDMLRLCPDLSSLTILTDVEQRAQDCRPFTHTNLRSFRVAHDLSITEQLSHLFDVLTLPNLHMFEARYIQPAQIHALFDVLDSLPPLELCELDVCLQPWPHEEMRAMLARSNCSLKSLVFSGGVMATDEQRAEYVALIPSLKVVVSSAAR